MNRRNTLLRRLCAANYLDLMYVPLLLAVFMRYTNTDSAYAYTHFCLPSFPYTSRPRATWLTSFHTPPAFEPPKQPRLHPDLHLRRLQLHLALLPPAHPRRHPYRCEGQEPGVYLCGAGVFVYGREGALVSLVVVDYVGITHRACYPSTRSPSLTVDGLTCTPPLYHVVRIL